VVEFEQAGDKINEALTTTRLEENPRVVKVYTVKTLLNQEKPELLNICIIAEYCEGQSLEKEIRRRATQGQPWTDDQLLDFLMKMAEVMAKC